MRNPFLPPEPQKELQAREVHELIRDYPELLSVFRQLGVRVRENGTSLLSAGPFPGMDEKVAPFQSLVWRGKVGS